MPEETPAVDGRTARAQRTRHRIVEACLDLVEDGDLRPTAPRIAERAEVSVRSVFQHFDDLENLYAAVADGQVDRLVTLISEVDPSLPLEERIELFCSQRTRLLEAITPIRLAAQVHAPNSAVITERVRRGRDFLRDELLATFDAEIGADPHGNQLAHALEVALGWTSWHELRSTLELSIEDSRDVVARLVRAVLRPSTDSSLAASTRSA